MSTTTPRLGLYKPATTGENVNVATDINGNMDDIDAAAGFRPVTAGTMPASPAYDGECVHQTDSDRFYVGTGGDWLQIVTEDVIFKDHIRVRRALATDAVFFGAADADTQDRYAVAASGLMEWGAGGVTPRDTNLYRNGANELKTDDNFTVAGNLAVTGIGSKLWARKNADESTGTNDTTLSDCAGLSVTLPAVVAEWRFNAHIYYISLVDNVADIKVQWINPAGATHTQIAFGLATTISGASPYAQVQLIPVGFTAGVIAAGSVAAVQCLHVTGHIRTNGTGGTSKVQFAQNTASLNVTTVKAESWMEYERVA